VGRNADGIAAAPMPLEAWWMERILGRLSPGPPDGSEEALDRKEIILNRLFQHLEMRFQQALGKLRFESRLGRPLRDIGARSPGPASPQGALEGNIQSPVLDLPLSFSVRFAIVGVAKAVYAAKFSFGLIIFLGGSSEAVFPPLQFLDREDLDVPGEDGWFDVGDHG